VAWQDAAVTGSAATLGVISGTAIASGVECVEALTIVLAMGVTRGWRATLWGIAAAAASLTAITLLIGSAIGTAIPRAGLQLVVGSLLLVFGLQWLRKAVLRAAGMKAMHDEARIFAEETQAAAGAERSVRLGLDWYAFVVSFKGVFLEGLEVVFIVLTFGASSGKTPLAAGAAAAAALVVCAAGVIVHRPLARVPENTLKFIVGVLLATYGVFWIVEGLGVVTPTGASLTWPGGDAALVILAAAWIMAARVLVITLRRRATLVEAAV
jgi:Ca2+/H+ antiporter, TMEM165/GDT1 family